MSEKSKREKRQYIQDYKMAHGCSVCGYDSCADALEFDHVDREAKDFKLANAPSYSWDRIHKEISKCVILCANCHREKTTKEKDFLGLNFEEPEDKQLSLL